MMLIISISIVGIYSMVSNGQKLATLTDDRLTGINIAKEGIESIGALRDTFDLRSYNSNDCFFTIDGKNYGNCPLVTSPATYYTLSDTKTLLPNSSNDFSVCINEHTWYSQEKTDTSGICNKSVTTLCGGHQVNSCRTRFTRKIFFQMCSNPSDLHQCIKARVEVSWATDVDRARHTDDDKTIILEQIFTKK